MRGIAAVFYRDYRQRMTNLAFVLWDVFIPLAYLALFGIGFERMIGEAIVLNGEAFGYIAFLLPGIIAMLAFSVAMNTAWGFFMDKDSGIFYELLTYPITRTQLLVGKIGFSVLLALAGSLLAILLGTFGMGARVRWDLLPVTAAAAIAGTAAWFFLFSTLAIHLRRLDAFNTLTSAAYILLMFLSTMFYPVDELPAWFRAVAYVNPMTWQVDVLRFGLLGAGEPMTVLYEAIALGLFTLLCLALAVRTLNHAE